MRHKLHTTALLLLTLWLVLPTRAAVAPLPTGFNAAKLAEMDAAMTNAIQENKLPGGVIWLERHGQSYHRAYGYRAVAPETEPMTEDTIFDLASLTKVVATTPSIMLLVERGKVNLDEPVHTYLPDFKGEGRDKVTIRQLMTHTSGLPASFTRGAGDGYLAAIQVASQERPRDEANSVFRYSDVNFILLGEVVRRVSGTSLDVFAAKEIFSPLKMTNTCFLPSQSLSPRIAPTQRSFLGWLRGSVHDPKARAMGGVAGHAGVFSTAADLARYARMLLNGGELDGVRILQSETVKLMTSVQTPDSLLARRGLGWDIDTGYSKPRGTVFPLGSYGHTGFTGTCLWLDPFSQSFWILLSNRVHPDGKGNILALEVTLGTLAAEAVENFDFKNVPGALPPRLTNQATRVTMTNGPSATVLNGIDVLVKQNYAPLKKLRIGLITNHTGHDRRRQATIDLLKNAPEVSLKKLFSPEHGIRGQADEKIGDSVDDKTGLPVYSLYGQRRAPTPEQLQDLDALVFDIQDIGCRFYTYISTMELCMESAGKAGIKYFVLDRVNPINGVDVEGPVYAGKPSFTACHPLPLRYGMTIGELATMFNAERGFKANLIVIPVEGWRRNMWFDQTGLPWTNPSPNMRSLSAATFYPGIGLHETALSVGRGTPTPFELVGTPYVDAERLAAELNAAGLPGVRFNPTHYTPTYSTFKDKPCSGVNLGLVDREHLPSVDLGIQLALTLQKLYPKDFALDKLNSLLQHPPTIQAIRAGKSLQEIKQAWAAELDAFKKRREAYLLYK